MTSKPANDAYFLNIVYCGEMVNSFAYSDIQHPAYCLMVTVKEAKGVLGKDISGMSCMHASGVFPNQWYCKVLLGVTLNQNHLQWARLMGIVNCSLVAPS